MHPEDVEAIARRVAELVLDAQHRPPPELLTASQVAERFGVGRDWVYEHSVPLGALRLGDGPRARLRFNAVEVAAALISRPVGEGSPTPDRPPLRTPGRRPANASGIGAELLPIRGAE